MYKEINASKEMNTSKEIKPLVAALRKAARRYSPSYSSMRLLHAHPEFACQAKEKP